jgi:hypothetical protein
MYVIWYLEKATGTFHKIEVKYLDTAQNLWDILMSVDTVILRSTRPE